VVVFEGFSAAGLAGGWRIDRQIADARSGGVASMTGTAQFVADAGGFAYHETGQLVMPGGACFHAERRYLWRFSGAMIEVRFEDGRLFHLFDPARPGVPVTHPCGEDLYEGRYALSTDGWQAQWRVKGPRKDQVITTDYRR